MMYSNSIDIIIHCKEVHQQFEMRIGGAFKPLLLIKDSEVSIKDATIH